MLMTRLRESYLYYLWSCLVLLYRESAVCRMLTAAGDWCERQIMDSAILRFLCRESALSRAWPESRLCRILTAVVNVPSVLLHKLYKALETTFEDSFFSKLAFRIGEETAIAQSWGIMLLWVIPYYRWDNANSLKLAALLLVLLHAGAMHDRAFRLDLKHIGIYPLVLFGAIGLGLVCSYAPGLSLRYFGYHVSAALSVLVTVSAVQAERDVKRLAAGGAFCVAVSGAYGIVQRIRGVEVNLSYVDVNVNPGMPGRVYSFFDNPNTFAEVLILLLPLVLALVICSKSLLGKLAALGTFAVGVAALGMTYSRASWVGFAFAMVVFVILWKPRWVPAFGLLCIAAIPLLPSTIWNRILTITNTSDTSTSSRFPLYEAAIEVIKKSPVFGAGLGGAATQAYIRDYDLYHGTAPFVHAHNFYMQVWLEAGLLGITSLLASLLWGIRRAAGAVRRSADSAVRTLICAGAASMCGIMVCGLADYPWHYPRVMCIFWFVFALMLAGVKVCLRETEKTP